MNKIFRGFGIVMILSSFIILSGCISEAEPEVVVSEKDYAEDPDPLPWRDAHENISDAYSGSDLSIELRDELIDDMKQQAEELGEDPEVLFKAIKTVYNESWEKKPMIIPCYAEKCYYDGDEVWAIVFNRANSPDGDIDHYNGYFVSIKRLETDKDPILYDFKCR